jgi:hypothetical protein
MPKSLACTHANTGPSFPSDRRTALHQSVARRRPGRDPCRCCCLRTNQSSRGAPAHIHTYTRTHLYEKRRHQHRLAPSSCALPRNHWDARAEPRSQWQHRRKYPEPGWSGHGAAHLALRRGRSPVRVRPRRPCRGWGITQPAYTSETDTRRPAAPLVVRSALPPIIDRRAPRRARGPAPPSSVIAQCRDGHARPLAIASAADRPATVPLLRSGSPPPAAPERACPA